MDHPHASSRHILVTGATGYIGGRLVPRLLEAGHTVTVLARSPQKLSDVPGGVVNILTGSPAEMAPWLAGHADVNAIDLTGAAELDWVDLEIAAAETLKRVLRPAGGVDAAAPALERITWLTETKTVWHTKALI